MEGGQFSGERSPARPGPGFEPPADPGAGGPSVHGLSLVARIMRGRELAAEAAGIPPLDSDQVLDLQRTAGNSLTTSALSRWTDVLEAALSGEEQAALAPFRSVEEARRHPPAVLLDVLLPARAADIEAHAAIAVALDTLDPRVRVVVSCTAGRQHVEIAVHGPAGGRAGTRRSSRRAMRPTLEPRLRRRVRPGRPARRRRARSTVTVAGAPPTELPLPFAAPRAIQTGDARLVAFAELA